MGYEQDFKYKDALKSLFDAAKTVSENVFTNDRPLLCLSKWIISLWCHCPACCLP